VLQKKILFISSIFITQILFSDQLKYVEFKNNKTFNDKELYEVLGLQTPSWYEFYKDKRAKTNTKLIDSLQDILTNYYKMEGFYHVDIQKDETNSTVVYEIDSGKGVYISDIKSNLSKKYQKLINQKEGKRFSATKFIDSKANIKKELLLNSYCNYILEAKALVDLEKNSVSLKYNLQKNSPCKFGDISINLPKNVDEKVVRSRLNFKKGSLYSSKKVRDAYSSISGLEAFNSIQIKQDKKSETINLTIDLKRKSKTIRQEIGVGYETNLGPKGIFKWEQRNFQGGARKISFDFKYSKKEQYLKNSFYWPAFMQTPFFNDYYLDLKNDFIFSKYEYDKFDESKIANHTHLLKDYHLFSIDFGLGLERIKIEKTGDICNISDGHFFLLYPFANLMVDTRDSKINPKNGLYMSAYLESGMKFLASDVSYSKFLVEARTIKSWDRLTVALKAKLGFISEFEKQLPESKRFFAGGAFSNRAYGYNRLGATDSSCDDMGGKTLLDTTAEADYWVYKKFGVAAFYDSTMITEKSLDFQIDFNHAIGVGIRYLTPIGPVKIDFGMDVENHDQYALHFQIGQSF
jgi:translocation and assembly module TamA